MIFQVARLILHITTAANLSYQRCCVYWQVAFIDQMASEGRIVAVGECGLDWYYVSDPESIAEQERVLRLLIEGEEGRRGRWAGQGCGALSGGRV